MLRAVIFDMDDTVVDWSGRQGEWSEHSRRHVTPIYDFLQAQQHTLPPLEDFVQVYREQTLAAWSRAAPPDWDSPYQPGILHATLHACGVNTAIVDIEHITRLFAWDAIPGVRPYDDTIPILQAIRSQDLKTGMVTNAAFPMWMRDVELRTLGLLEYFDARLTAGDVGKLKPHPRPFEAILERLGVSADETVFVGDRIQDDILGPQQVGMRAIWVRRPRGENTGETKPNAIIDGLTQLLDVLDLWFPAWR